MGERRIHSVLGNSAADEHGLNTDERALDAFFLCFIRVNPWPFFLSAFIGVHLRLCIHPRLCVRICTPRISHAIPCAIKSIAKNSPMTHSLSQGQRLRI